MELANYIDDSANNSSAGLLALGRNGPAASLVLDTQRGELVKASPGVRKERLADGKAVAALKNHSEAEKRRRERINGHLDTLRSLIPGTNKMDKASLLAEVISHLKDLKKDTAEVTRGLAIPSDTDEISIDGPDDLPHGPQRYIKASICCGYRHELLSDLRRSLDALDLKMERVEMSSLAGKMKTIISVTGFAEADSCDAADWKQLPRSVHQALKSVLDKISASPEFLSGDMLRNKRQQVLLFSYSNSCSTGDVW